MRELKQQEIDNAPEWATHYYVDYDDSVSFNRGAGCSKPIPRKSFHISNHEFDDKFHLTSCHVDDCGDVEISLANSPTDTYITKQDAIALAKHFKLI